MGRNMSQVQTVADDLWVVDAEIQLAPATPLPVRMTVVRLASSQLILYSPVRIDDALAREIDDLGEVAHILAPNKFHHFFAVRAKERYPRARLWGAPGLAQKRPNIEFDGVLGPDTLADCADDVALVHIGGVPMVEEVVMLHRPSKTLIVTDLVFNMGSARGFTRVAMWLFGGHNRFAHSRSWRWVFVRDKAKASVGVSQILAWDFDRIVPAHGEILEGDARAQLRAVLSYLTDVRRAEPAQPLPG